MASFFHGIMDRLDQKLHEENAITSYLEKAEKATGVKRVYLAIGLLSFLAVYLIVGYGSELICNSIGFVYPAYCSIHAIESHNKEDDTKWLTYWVVYALFSIVEFFSDILLDWFPFYWLAKCIFLIWCFAPISANGSQVLYHRFIRPVFLTHSVTIDSVVSSVKEKAISGVSKLASDNLKTD